MTTSTGIPITDSGAATGLPDGQGVTYNLTAEDGAVVTRSQLRLLINDTVAGGGPRPAGRNFTDSELDTFLELEGGNLYRAAALVFEALMSAWSALAERVGLGPQTYESTQARRYKDLALHYRQQYGHGKAGGTEDGQFVSWAGAFNDWYPHP